MPTNNISATSSSRGAGSVTRTLRIVSGGVGILLLIYFGGGLLSMAVQDQLNVTHITIGVGLFLGACFVLFGVFGGRPNAVRVARGAFIGGTVGAVLAFFPGALILGQFVGGVAPLFWSAIVTIPIALFVGMIIGGVFALRSSR